VNISYSEMHAILARVDVEKTFLAISMQSQKQESMQACFYFHDMGKSGSRVMPY